MALLATTKPLDASRLHDALEQTFTFRNTHALPAALPDPLDAWRGPYEAIAREDRLPWATLAEVASTVKAFLDPVLAGGLSATWDHRAWRWGT
jgi:hypothetical protein